MEDIIPELSGFSLDMLFGGKKKTARFSKVDKDSLLPRAGHLSITKELNFEELVFLMKQDS